MSRESTWVNRFLTYRFPLLKNEIQLDVAKEILLKHKPEKLYKYRQADNVGFSVIQNEELWLARADTVNDPYDCYFTHNPENILDSNERIIQAVPPIFDENVIQFGLRGIESIINYQRDCLRKRIKLCSLSKQFDILKMWERYSQFHTGFCVEFDLQKSNDAIWDYLFPVHYSNIKVDFTNYVKILLEKPHVLNQSFIRRALLTKSLDWEYENEWRIITPDKPEMLGVRCSCIPISCVYLGYMASQDTVVHIESICRPKGISVKNMQLDGHLLVAVGP